MGRDREKRYLRQIREIDTDISNKIADCERWKQKANSFEVIQEGDRVQTSAICDKMKLADIYIDIELEIQELYEKRKRIIRDIQSLPHPYSDILFKRYVLNMMFKEIADKHHHNANWATTMHGRALEGIGAILDRRERNE